MGFNNFLPEAVRGSTALADTDGPRTTRLVVLTVARIYLIRKKRNISVLILRLRYSGKQGDKHSSYLHKSSR